MGRRYSVIRLLIIGVFTNARHLGFFSSSGYSPDIQGRGYGEEDDEDGRTEIIYAVSEIGTITDFIKAHTMYTIEDYKWNLNPRFIRIMIADNTRIHYLSDKQAKRKNAVVVNDANSLINDLGVPVLSREMFEAQQQGSSNK